MREPDQFMDPLNPGCPMSSSGDEASACEGKVSFASAHLAHQAAKRTEWRGGKREVYRCAFCNQFHVGGPRKRMRRPESLMLRRPRNRNGVRQAWGRE